MSDAWNDEAELLLRKWLDRARRSQHSHHEQGKFLKRVNYWFAIPIIVITTTLGTSAFATLSQDVSPSMRLWFGGLSILAAVLAAIQTRLNFISRSETHKSLGAKYGNVRRQIEETLVLSPTLRGDPRTVLSEIRGKLDSLGSEGDAVHPRIFTRTVSKLREAS